MKITVLGYESPYPGPYSNGPGYLLEHENKYYLIDVGSGVLSQLQQVISLNQLEAVFISHLHHDHMSDFLVLQYAIQMEFIMKGRVSPLKVYFPNNPGKEAELIPFKNFIDPHYINEETRVQFSNLDISFLRTDHGVPTYAMKFETKNRVFVYGSDSGIMTNWSPYISSPDLLILECTYLEKHRPETPMGHLATSDVAKISQQVKPKKLLVTHFYTEYDPQDIEIELKRNGVYGELIMPEIGKVIDV